jgi:hypothetical protein
MIFSEKKKCLRHRQTSKLRHVLQRLSQHVTGKVAADRTSVAISAESSFFVPFYPPILQDTGNTGFQHILMLSHANETLAKMPTSTITWRRSRLNSSSHGIEFIILEGTRRHGS